MFVCRFLRFSTLIDFILFCLLLLLFFFFIAHILLSYYLLLQTPTQEYVEYALRTLGGKVVHGEREEGWEKKGGWDPLTVTAQLAMTVVEIVVGVVWYGGSSDSGLDFDPGQHAKGYLLAVVVEEEQAAVQVQLQVQLVATVVDGGSRACGREFSLLPEEEEEREEIMVLVAVILTCVFRLAVASSHLFSFLLPSVLTQPAFPFPSLLLSLFPSLDIFTSSSCL